MGMYTELLFKAEIKKDDLNVLNILKFLFDEDDENNFIVPNHEFFKCDRWKQIGRSCSFYHHPSVVSDVFYKKEYSSFRIFSRSDLKNYDNEISKFIDWIMPYIEEDEGKCIGWSWYEEENSPTLLYKRIK